MLPLILVFLTGAIAFQSNFVVPPSGGSIGDGSVAPVQINGIFPSQPTTCAILVSSLTQWFKSIDSTASRLTHNSLGLAATASSAPKRSECGIGALMPWADHLYMVAGCHNRDSFLALGFK